MSCCMTVMVIIGVVGYMLHAQTERSDRIEAHEMELVDAMYSKGSDQYANHSQLVSPPSVAPSPRARVCFLDVADLTKYSVEHSATLPQNSAHTVHELGRIACAGGYTIGRHVQPSVLCTVDGGTFMFTGCEVKPTCDNVYLGPAIGFAHVMEYHDGDGSCHLSMKELGRVCSSHYSECLSFLRQAGRIGAEPEPGPGPEPEPAPQHGNTGLPSVVPGGNPQCWSAQYTFNRCCDLTKSVQGDQSCWTPVAASGLPTLSGYDFVFCCTMHQGGCIKPVPVST